MVPIFGLPFDRLRANGICLRANGVRAGDKRLVREVAQFLNKDRIGLAQQVGVFLLHLAQNPHAQAGAGERVAVDHVVGQAQGHAQLAHFVLEQVAQRFQQLQAQLFRQAAHVVVAFNDDGFFAFCATRFDHVRVNGALGQKADFACLIRQIYS